MAGWKTEGDSGGFQIEERGKKSMTESCWAAGTQTDSLRVMMRSGKRQGQRHRSRREDRACVEENKREIRGGEKKAIKGGKKERRTKLD